LKKFSKLRQYSKLPEPNDPVQKTEWEKKHTKLRTEIANERLARRKAELEGKNKKRGGLATDHPVLGMGEVRETRDPFSTDLSKKKSTEEFERFAKGVDSILNSSYDNLKQKLMRENYIKGLIDHEILDGEIGDEILKFINGISLDKFEETVKLDEYGTFEWYKDKRELRIRQETILDAWKTAFEEEQETKIKKG
jgi:hypothetical protein